MPHQQFSPVSLPVQGGSLRLYVCRTCWAIIDPDHLLNHEQWHARQREWIQNMLGKP